jgi:ComF family protein
MALPEVGRRGAPGPAAERAFYALPFEGPARALVHALKYERRTSAARALVALSAPALDSLPLVDVEVMIPVPLHPLRRRERGFNQALLLAVALRERTGIPVADGLRRVRPTIDQTDLSREGRLANVRGAFAGCRRVVEGARVLLVDDVVTTGATFAEGVAELRRAGALSVACLAVTGRDDGSGPGGRAARNGLTGCGRAV